MIELYNNKLLKRKIIKFSHFAKKYPDLNLNQLVDFYCIFDGLDNIKIYNNIEQSIEENILKRYNEIDFNLNDSTCYALSLFAKNNRKRYSINRKIQHFKALSIVKNLLREKILIIEKSKEIQIPKNKKQKIKKELRSYTIQDKLLFKNHFTRFFFYFLKPNEKLILKKDYIKILNLIKNNFEFYQSFCFEQLAREFLEKKFQIQNVQSYWNKNLELDLYYKDEKLCLIGEVKFKNKKICTNVFNQLKYKAKNLNLNPDFYIFFSKNGFSKKFEKKREQNLLLFQLSDLKELL